MAVPILYDQFGHEMSKQRPQQGQVLQAAEYRHTGLIATKLSLSMIVSYLLSGERGVLMYQMEMFDQMVEQLKKAPMQLPHPKYVVIITVDSVFDQSVGPKAGQRIV